MIKSRFFLLRSISLLSLLAVLGLGAVMARPAQAATNALPARCENGGDYGSTLEEDTI